MTERIIRRSDGDISFLIAILHPSCFGFVKFAEDQGCSILAAWHALVVDEVKS